MNDIRNRIIEMLVAAPTDRSGWLLRTNNKPICRQALGQIEAYLQAFQRTANNQWLIMPGLRGVGKTTILSQLYLDAQAKPDRKFFLSLERIKLIGGSMVEVISAIEEVAGSKLESINDPLFIFFDEVQYMSDWALAVKVIFDRAPNAFIVCTGSSAIELQTNADIARRSLKIFIHPLCFTEYAQIRRTMEEREIIDPGSELSTHIEEAMFASRSPLEVLSRLEATRDQTAAYWQQIDRLDYIDDFMEFGTLPSTLSDPSAFSKRQRVDSLLRESLAGDIDASNQFETSTKNLFPRLLSLLANSDTISIGKLASHLELNQRTVVAMVNALEQADIIQTVKPRGSAYRQVRQANKYLFTSPAMRTALCLSGGQQSDSLRGRLLEDIVGLYLKKMITTRQLAATLEYDYSAGGADFIISYLNYAHAPIAIEVGLQKRTADQAYTTLKRISAKYALVISNVNLAIDTKKEAVFVPLSDFLLI